MLVFDRAGIISCGSTRNVLDEVNSESLKLGAHMFDGNRDLDVCGVIRQSHCHSCQRDENAVETDGGKQTTLGLLETPNTPALNME